MKLTRLAVVVLATLIGCGPGSRDSGDSCTGLCTALGYQACNADGSFEPPVACNEGETCDPTHGCVVCVADELYCDGPNDNDIYRCNGSGSGGTLVESCPADQACSGGMCKTPCQAAEDNPSNVGCDFWAADLDNESSTGAGLNNDAAAQQFAIVVANNNDYPVTVTVAKNVANIGQPVNEQLALQTTVEPHVARRIDLPQREVDGSMGQNGTYTPNSGSGTFVSPHAYHVTTTGPVVVYQFNPIIQQFSNDASTLVPRQAVGTEYIVSGFETANPCGITGLPVPQGIPDRGAITIIPIEDDTHVTVTTNHAIKASGGASGLPIAATPKGGTLQLTLSRFMAANLETEQMMGDIGACTSAINGGMDGDFTGTYIKSDKPVVVFTSNERGAGFGGATNVEYPPGWDPETDDICCTEHLEEQLFPVTALGKEFAVARSPIRSTHPTWREPDIIRVVGTVDGTAVTTNLPAPWNSFTLNAREDKTFAATTGFALSASAPVQLSSYLVSQHFVTYGYIGDPSQLLIPAAEQHRKDYVFLVPSTFDDDYVAFSKPVAAQITLDGTPLDTHPGCVKADIGTVASVPYEQVTCSLTDGQHYTAGDQPFGISVYGYHSVGSYSYVGGSDVKIINPIL